MAKPPPTLLLARSVVAGLAGTRDYLEAMRIAFGGLAAGRYQMPDPQHLTAIGGAFHAKSAISTERPALAVVKLNGNFPGNAAAPALPTIQGFIAVLDAEHGCVLALMDSLQLDALIYPTWSNVPRLIGDLNTPHGDNNQLFSPSTGFPAITVPMGYVRGVPMARAAAGSMAAYPFYAPVELRDGEGRPFRIGHYTPVVIDGEDRDPFTTDVAEESGADLVFVSSISTPYKYLHSVGSLARLGFPELHAQKATQSRDAKQENAARAHVMTRRLFDEGRRVLERAGCGEEAVGELHAAFQRLAWVDHVRIRITPDPDLAVESRLLRRLDPLSFTPQAVDRAFDLGRRVAERVLRRYSFDFL